MISRFKQLYRKYVNGHIGLEEFKELRGSIDNVSDDCLWNAMIENADGCGFVPMSDEMKEAVKHRLRHSVMRLRLRSYFKYAAAAVISVLLITAAVTIGINIRTIPAQEFTASIPAGSHTNLTLPDRTRVQLNSASELNFEWDTEGERTVRLYGEAYFDVAKDREHTFRVLVSDMEVEVHGTSFNVNAYDDDNITVSLVSGKVSLGGSGLKGNKYIMQPGEKATYSRTDGSVLISKADMSIETGWTRGDLVFKRKKLSEVIAMIERRYGVEIEIQCDSISNDTLTGKFSNEDVTDVLSSLSDMYNFKYTIKKNRITIY
ncbi:FecR family protein [Barnesiella viscericola]|uniref:DUF4974 domain-containing protein n=1 Tax=Barnesiella viscericola TaxID=397865 RepID=A0A921MS07_9BACT|nr:FecR domain-containing protein [Barnesiella viscericola]HJG89367.1 DUF4974 domain-containing protein [Barnesiella viscericola]